MSFKKNKNKKIINSFATISLASLSLLLTFGQLVSSPKVDTAGVSLTVTPSTNNVATSGNVSVSFVTTSAMSIGNTITLTYSNSYTGTISTVNTTVNTVAPSNVSNSVSGSNIVSVLTLANNISNGATVTISTTALTTPNTAGNYSFLIRTTNDFGGNFQYVGQANVVQVTAFVPTNLSFSIRNSADTANTNVCNLGDAFVSSVVSCSYRLKVGTNAKNGYTISMISSGNLTNGTDNMNNAAVGSSGTGGTNISAGTENYGVVVSPGSVTRSGGTVSLGSIFNAGATNSVLYNYTSNQALLTANKPNNPATSGDTTNTSLVTHNLGITTDTPTGSYQQTVTYTVSPSF